MAFWIVSVVLALVCESALMPNGQSVAGFLGKQTILRVISLVGFVAVLRLAWRCVGGRAPYLSLFIPFAYLQGVAYVFGGLVRLLSLGIAKLFDPALAQAMLSKGDPSAQTDPLDAHLQKAFAGFQAGNRMPLVIAALVVGLPLLAFLLAWAWVFLGWGAFRELNGVSKRRSFLAWMIWLVIFLIALPIMLLIGAGAAM